MLVRLPGWAPALPGCMSVREYPAKAILPVITAGIPETNVILIDEELPEDVVSFFDAFGNATHTALMWDLVGEDVLITGAGPIGIIAAGICKFAGARRVVITDVNDYRLELARKMNVDAAVNTAKEDLRK